MAKGINLTQDDKKLIKIAGSLVNPTKVPGGILKEVGCALITKSGKVFTGVCLDLFCGIGFCAEHSAVAEMVSHSDETEIKTIVAFGNGNNILFPCGRCRELLQQINKSNRENCEVIVPGNKKIKLGDLLPGNWM
jgi:cytidine deaminase